MDGASLSDLEATRSTTTTSLLELAALGANIRRRLGVGNARSPRELTLLLALVTLGIVGLCPLASGLLEAEGY